MIGGVHGVSILKAENAFGVTRATALLNLTPDCLRQLADSKEKMVDAEGFEPTTR